MHHETERDPSGHEMWPRQKGHNWGSAQGKNLCGAPLISWARKEPILGLELRKIFTALLKPFLSQLLEGFLQEFPGFLSWFLVHYYRIQQRRFFFKLHSPFSAFAVWCLHFTHTSSSLPPPPLLFLLFIYLFIFKTDDFKIKQLPSYFPQKEKGKLTRPKLQIQCRWLRNKKGLVFNS